MSELKGRILSIDYGLKRVGLALSDPMQIISSPYKALQNTPELKELIVDIIISEDVTEVIIGLPVREDGTPSEIYDEVKKFKVSLEEDLDIPVKEVDERYSSSIAKERMIITTPGKKKRRDKNLIDILSAQILLEDYLNGKTG